ncbi:MAG: hypothetical protein ACRDTH_00110, partial [Pseudonocardiaceae bacterium]
MTIDEKNPQERHRRNCARRCSRAATPDLRVVTWYGSQPAAPAVDLLSCSASLGQLRRLAEQREWCA